jgi:dTDP-4-dehydrorhamnose reductase
MKILLLGRNGRLAWELQRSLAPLGELIALNRHSTEHCGDLADLQGLARTVQAVRPEVIVNAATTALPSADRPFEQGVRSSSARPKPRPPYPSLTPQPWSAVP